MSCSLLVLVVVVALPWLAYLTCTSTGTGSGVVAFICSCLAYLVVALLLPWVCRWVVAFVRNDDINSDAILSV